MAEMLIPLSKTAKTYFNVMLYLAWELRAQTCLHARQYFWPKPKTYYSASYGFSKKL